MAKKKKKPKKIVKYRRPLNLNVGMIIFACIFIYMAFSVYAYITKEKIQFYEVTEGNIVKNRYYTGIILREEEVVNTEHAGYINYYVREGKKVAVGSSIYSVDETGALATALSQSKDETVPLKDDQIQHIRNQLSSFTNHFDQMNYYSVYNLKNSLDSTVLDHMNDQVLDYMDSIADRSGISFIQYTSKQAGVISYAIDQYEGLEAEQVKESDFDRGNYMKNMVKPGDLVEKDSPIFKYILSDQWSVVFPLTEPDLQDYGAGDRLQVRFLGRDVTSYGDYSVISGADGVRYGKIDFDKYILQFLSDRFLDFEIVTERSNGLKIPVSSVTTKTFYLIPIDFLTYGGDSAEEGFNKEVYSETGPSVEFIAATRYFEDEKYYYVDAGDDALLKVGDNLIKPDSSEKFQVGMAGMTATLEGVYNINKGFAVFKQIEVLDQNNEYYTVKKNTKYGLAVYDHIVLNANTIEGEGVFIYQ